MSQDAATRTALNEARGALSAVLGLNGVALKPAARGKLGQGARRGANSAVTTEAVLAYIEQHPCGRAEDIAAALGTDTKGLRPALVKLKASGQVRASGVARATRYYADQ